MKNFKKYIKTHRYAILFISIVLLAIILRFIDYPDRWGLAYDQAHDALVARYALEAFKLPLLGPFSSAGPFQTGGEWYWVIMFGTSLYPPSVLSPWIFLTSVYVLFVAGIMLLGKELVNKKFSLIVGVLAAVSTAQILQGANLTNQGPQAIVALAGIWFCQRYAKERKNKYLFLLGLMVGLASSIHLQGVALGSLVVSLLLLKFFPNIKGFLLLALGFFLPWIPVLIVDIQNNFFTLSHMFQYYLHDQYKISLDVLGRRWLTYAGVFWPQAWGHIIGGQTAFGYVLMAGVVIVAATQIIQKNVDKKFFLVAISFLIGFTVLRYTRTPLFDSYLVFLHPFVLLLTAWTISFVISKSKIIGFTFLLLIVAGSFYKDINEINKAKNHTAQLTTQLKNSLIQEFPEENFAVYSFKGQYNDKNAPLSLFLAVENKAEDSGRRIGIVQGGNVKEKGFKLITETKDGYRLVDLSAYSDAELQKSEWTLMTPKAMYFSTEEWYKEQK